LNGLGFFYDGTVTKNGLNLVREGFGFKEKIVRKIIARIEIDTDKVFVEYWVGKGHFRREINSLPSSQVPETPNFLKNVGSRTCHNGAQDWTT
jgi:hypothetical protein